MNAKLDMKSDVLISKCEELTGSHYFILEKSPKKARALIG